MGHTEAWLAVNPNQNPTHPLIYVSWIIARNHKYLFLSYLTIGLNILSYVVYCINMLLPFGNLTEPWTISMKDDLPIIFVANIQGYVGFPDGGTLT